MAHVGGGGESPTLEIPHDREAVEVVGPAAHIRRAIRLARKLAAEAILEAIGPESAAGESEAANGRRDWRRRGTDPGNGDGSLQMVVRRAPSGLVVIGTTVADTPGPGLTLPPKQLTPRQLEVLRLLAHGHNNAAIAEDTVITEKSVENIVNAIFHRLAIPRTGSVHPRVMAALTYLETGRVE